MPFLGFSIGAGINFMDIFRGGMAGVVISVLTVLAAFIISVPSDIYINRRPGWAAIGIYTAAGNSFIVPNLVTNLDPSWSAYEHIAAAQVGTVVILTSILVPFVCKFWIKIKEKK